MPFVANMDNEDDQKQNQPQGGGAVRLAPSTGVQTGGATTAGAGASPTASGGAFGSLNQYLKANQSNAEPLAGKLTAGIGKEYQGLEGQNQSTLSTIGGQVSANPSYSDANDIIAKEAANPVSFAGDANNVSSFQNLLKASYSGPASAESTNEYANQQNAINNAIAQGQSTVKTPAGRENLLAKNEATPTTGVTALNSAILSKSPTALASVENAYKPFANLLTGLQGGAADTNKAIAERQSSADAAKKASNEALTSQITGLNTAVQGQLTTAQQKAAADNQAIKDALASGNIFSGGSPGMTAQQVGIANYGNRNNPSYVPQSITAATPGTLNPALKALGLTDAEWNDLSAAQKAAATSQVVSSNQGQFNANSGTANLNLSDWLSQTDPNTVLNAGNVATADQYKQAQAFQSLLNGLNLETPSLAINPTNAGQAGTAPTNMNTFDYKTALQTAKDTKAAETAAAQAYVDALQSGADEEHAQLAAAAAQKKATMLNLAGLAQTPIGATTGAVKGAVAAGQNVADQVKNTISSPKNAAINTAANIATGGLYSTGQTVAKSVTQAVKTVTDIFCFHPDTLITMDDDSQLPIWKVEVGDLTKGGRVLATTRAVGQYFYWYNGVIVTGKHAVKENGRWIRVENSEIAHPISQLTEIVHNLVTEKHRIYANGIEFADQYETDMYESLNMDESLQEMNRNA